MQGLIEELDRLPKATQDHILLWLSAEPLTDPEYKEFKKMRRAMTPALYRKLDSVLSARLVRARSGSRNASR